MGNVVPIHAHRQFSSWTMMGPFMLIGSFFTDNIEPICAHPQFHSLARMGQFVLLGSFLPR